MDSIYNIAKPEKTNIEKYIYYSILVLVKKL